jgi:hypothetical protein
MRSSKDCADWTIKGPGNVLKGHIGKMAKQEYLPICFRQPSQCHLKGVHVFLKMQGIKGSGSFSRELVGQFDPISARFHDGGLRRVPGEIAAMVSNQIDQYAEQPGFKLTLIIIPANALNDAEEGLLHEILGKFGFMGRTQCITKKPLPIGIDQYVPSGGIAGLAPHQKVRDGTSVHGHLRKTPISPRYCGSPHEKCALKKGGQWGG